MYSPSKPNNFLEMYAENNFKLGVYGLSTPSTPSIVHNASKDYNPNNTNSSYSMNSTMEYLKNISTTECTINRNKVVEQSVEKSVGNVEQMQIGTIARKQRLGNIANILGIQSNKINNFHSASMNKDITMNTLKSKLSKPLVLAPSKTTGLLVIHQKEASASTDLISSMNCCISPNHSNVIKISNIRISYTEAISTPHILSEVVEDMTVMCSNYGHIQNIKIEILDKTLGVILNSGRIDSNIDKNNTGAINVYILYSSLISSKHALDNLKLKTYMDCTLNISFVDLQIFDNV